MCGRFALTASVHEVAAVLGLDQLEDFPPRYNIAPTQPILVAVNGPAGDRIGVLVRWGLMPGWVKDPRDFPLLLNARAETAAEKPAFRNAMRHRRVLVPATGFYEWKRPPGGKGPKQAYWIRPHGGGVITFGGLMETWHSADGGEIDTGLIITTRANTAIAAIHDRMPVVIRPGDHMRWLDCMQNEPRHVADLMQPAEDDFFEAIPVGDRVNKVANSGPDIQEPVQEQSAPAASEPESRTAPGGGKTQLDLF